MGSIAGKAIVLAFAAVLVAAFVIVVAYKVQEAGEPPSWMRFTRLDAEAGAAPSAPGPADGPQSSAEDSAEDGPGDANATAFRLDFRAVHAAYFLEDHLDTAASQGTSLERVRLRVETMRDTLQSLTGHPGPAWTVEWDGTRILVETGSGATPEGATPDPGASGTQAPGGPLQPGASMRAGRDDASATTSDGAA